LAHTEPIKQLLRSGSSQGEHELRLKRATLYPVNGVRIVLLGADWGTGSTPPGWKGWHRSRRLDARNRPLKGPCWRIAWWA